MPNSSTLNIDVTFRHTEPTEALRTYAEEKISSRLQKYLTGNAEVHVILSVEKRDHQAEVQVHSRVFEVTSKATTDDLYSAIDKVVDTLSIQIKKKKEKMIDHKHTTTKEVGL
jgi:putative sigma-54 modulation protein